MAELTEASHLYELLFRGRSDGTWAAHQKRVTVIARDGAFASAREEDPRPVAPEEAAAVVGEVVAGLVAERDALLARVADLEAADAQ